MKLTEIINITMHADIKIKQVNVSRGEGSQHGNTDVQQKNIIAK